MSPVEGQAGNQPVYKLQLRTPLIKTPSGNEHIIDIRVQPKALDVVLGWDSHPGEYSFASVPWDDIRNHAVKYGLPEFYDPHQPTSRSKQTPLAPDPLRRVETDPSRFGLKSVDVVGAKKTGAGEVYVFGKHEIIKLKLPAQVVWRAELPSGHTLVAFDLSENLLWIATNSDQGHRDGELQLPFQTTQVYAILPGK